MFRSITFVPIDAEIRSGIPKVASPRQAEAFNSLNISCGRFRNAIQKCERASFASVPDASLSTVFVGSTAYNFLNVFLKPTGRREGVDEQLSSNPLHALRCASPDDAFRVFAALHSRLAFWWWHIHVDGFHVTRQLVEDLPFGQEIHVDGASEKLASLGQKLWENLKFNPIVSLNRGRTSFAYPSIRFSEERGEIDKVLVAIIGLNQNFVGELEGFSRQVTTATFVGNEVNELTGTDAHESKNFTSS
jgi:hypothetical protein